MTESNETKAPNYYRVVLLLEVDPDIYDGMREWEKTPEIIKQEVKKGLRIHLPAPCHDYQVDSIDEIYGCGIGRALKHRIDKITEHGG